MFQLAQGQALTDVVEKTDGLVQKKSAELEASDLEINSLMSKTSTLLAQMSFVGSQNMNTTEYLLEAVDVVEDQDEDTDTEDELDEELIELQNNLEGVKAAFNYRKEINEALDAELETINEEIREADKAIEEFNRFINIEKSIEKK